MRRGLKKLPCLMFEYSCLFSSVSFHAPIYIYILLDVLITNILRLLWPGSLWEPAGCSRDFSTRAGAQLWYEPRHPGARLWLQDDCGSGRLHHDTLHRVRLWWCLSFMNTVSLSCRKEEKQRHTQQQWKILKMVRLWKWLQQQQKGGLTF